MPRRKSLIPGPRKLKVLSARNTDCGVPLTSLDWSEWWIDCGFSGQILYLKVPKRDDDSVQRVYCRHSDHPRILMQDGVLYWLVDTQRPT